MKMAKSDADLLSPVKFGKLTFYNPPKILLHFDSWEAYNKAVSDQMGGRTRSIQYVINGDETHMRQNGSIVISSNEAGHYAVKVTMDSFKQLLHILRIPFDFATRMPSDLLVTLINRMLSGSYLKSIGIRLSPARDFIIGFVEYSRRLDEMAANENVSYYFLNNIMTHGDDYLPPSKIACDQNVTRAIFLASPAIQTKYGISSKYSNIKHFVEVIHSDNGSFRPHVTLGSLVHYATIDQFITINALYRDHKIKIDSGSCSDVINAMDMLWSKAASLPTMVNTTTVFSKDAATKILGKQFDWLVKPPVDISRVLSTLASARQDASSIMDIRKIGFIAGDFVRIAGQ